MSQHYSDQQKFRQLAYFDVLTGLPNRRIFLEELGAALAGVRQRGGCGALIFVDLDHFKTLNDSHGHGMGDELLVIVAARLRQAAGTEWLVARMGGDEFVLTLSNPATIFSFIAVFGALAGRAAVDAPGTMVLGVPVGSALWWLFLSSAVGRFRERFDSRWRRRVDLASATVLAGFALWQLGSLF